MTTKGMKWRLERIPTKWKKVKVCEYAENEEGNDIIDYRGRKVITRVYYEDKPIAWKRRKQRVYYDPLAWAKAFFTTAVICSIGANVINSFKDDLKTKKKNKNNSHKLT